MVCVGNSPPHVLLRRIGKSIYLLPNTERSLVNNPYPGHSLEAAISETIQLVEADLQFDWMLKTKEIAARLSPSNTRVPMYVDFEGC